MVVRSQRVILPDGERAASIAISHGTIVAIGAYDDRSRDDAVLDAGALVVSPGIVDTHVHVNEPGRTEWEGFDTATRAAAAGGVTTIVDMPLNSVPATTSVAGLRSKREAANLRCHVDVGFWGGVVPGNASELDALVDAGVRGFKCFLVPSGVDEFPAVDEGDLRRALPILARRRVPLLVHAEMGSGAICRSSVLDPLDVAETADRSRPAERYRTYLATRPPQMEVDATRLLIRLATEFRVRTHIVHVAAAEAADEIARARAIGVPITAETCPHYLTFAADEVPDGATEFKCAPPIRESRHRDALWDGLRRGVLDLVVTDHSPAPPALKGTGDFLRAWGGIASLELSLAAVWTRLRAYGASAGQAPGQTLGASLGTGLTDLARWMSAAPASLAGLAGRKGAIAVGLDADLIVWDPEAAFTVDPAALQQRHKLTPYAGRRLHGIVRTTFVRGERVWDEGRLADARSGHLL